VLNKVQRIREKCWQLLAITLCQLLVLQPAFPQGSAPRLKITVLGGAGAKNVVQQIAAKPIIVRVEDENSRPVAGATVVLTAPERGPSGAFTNDSSTIRLTTDTDGIANAGTFHPNAFAGKYQIQARAEFQGQNATASIAQQNTGQRQGHGKLIAIVALTGAAAAAAVAAARKGGSTSLPTITFGGAAVGAPK
jgi:hypothetical protein